MVFPFDVRDDVESSPELFGTPGSLDGLPMDQGNGFGWVDAQELHPVDPDSLLVGHVESPGVPDADLSAGLCGVCASVET